MRPVLVWRVPAAAALAAALGAVAPDASRAQAAGAGAAGEIVSPSALGDVTFPHGLHAEELGFACSDCHHETDAARLRMPHEEYFEDFWIECGICHREGSSPAAPQSCAGCHHASPVTTADETLSAKVVIHRSCWECHEAGTGEEASRSCGFCHAGRRAPAEDSR